MNANPGDLVVCVDASDRSYTTGAFGALVKGHVYRVSGARLSPTHKEPNLLLVEMPWCKVGWRSDRFRKLNDGDEIPGMIERIKQCKPAKVPA